MAALEGVKLIVEKIEYNGQTYVKSDDPAEVGDIVRMNDSTWDVTEGNYYEVISVDEDGDPEVYDDVDYVHNIFGDDYTVFKRTESVKSSDDGVITSVSTQYREQESAKWAKIGRKVGEYRAGDLVEILRTRPAAGVEAGEIAEVKESHTGGLGSDGVRLTRLNPSGNHAWIAAREITLIAPVEQRFDKADAS